MGRLRTVLVLLGVAAAVAIARHRSRSAFGYEATGGVLVKNAGAYNAFSRRLLGPFYEQIADDVVRSAPGEARILEVGCGPGHLSIRLARRYGLDVTGIDLDPAMIDQAQANATSTDEFDEQRPSFQVGDVAHLGVPDESFDLVVSTLSMHHWADPTAGLSEIGRVLAPGGRALIWDFRPGIWPLHRHFPDPVKSVQGSRLQVVEVSPWRWPWMFGLTQRVELGRRDESPRHAETQTGETPSDKGSTHG